MAVSSLKTALEDLLKAHRLQSEAPPLRGERRLSALGTGVPEIDEMLAGGFPRGEVSEIHGPSSSGRTALALAAVARAQRAGALAAWIDPADRLDPCSASESGLELSRLLWVRGPARPAGLSASIAAAGVVLGSGLFELVVFDLVGLAAEAARLPHTTWLRLQRAVEGGTGALLLLATAHIAHGPSGVSLAMAAGEGQWTGSGPGRLLNGLQAQARSGHQRMRTARFTLNTFA